MSQAEIGTSGLLLAATLILIAIALAGWQGLGLERSLVWSTLRAGVQLLVVGSALAIVLDPDTPLVLAFVWVALMAAFGGWTVQQRVRQHNTATGLAILPWAFAAFVVATVAVLGTLFGLGVYDLNATTLVPLAGMVIGNSISATVLVARRLLEETDDRREEIEARLALGHSSREAFRPAMRRAARTAVTPQIETTKAVGIVFLPGAMVGLILAGVDPIDAVRVQAAVMYMVLASVVTTVVIVAQGMSRLLFTADHRIALALGESGKSPAGR